MNPNNQPDLQNQEIQKPNKFKQLWSNFKGQHLFAKITIAILALAILLTPFIIAQQTNFFSHAGISPLTNCTPIPMGLTQQQIQQLSKNVRWCNAPAATNSIGSSASFVDTSFPTFASFMAASPQCVLPDGTVLKTNQFTTFGVDYAACRSQLLSDFQFLANKNVMDIRIWPVLTTFVPVSSGVAQWGSLNSNITNLDDALAKLASLHMKAYVTLLSTPNPDSTYQCTSYNAYYLTPSMLQDSSTQDAYIKTLSDFILRYKDNPAIGGYDVVNELSQLISKTPAPGATGGLCGLYYDDNRLIKLKAFLSRVYTTIKSIDTVHPITYSTAGIFSSTSPELQAIHNYVDFYDFHTYTMDPATYYSSAFGSYDKPVVQGEVGISQVVKDSSGNDCQLFGEDIAPMMSAECQQIVLTNVFKFAEQAKIHNIKSIFYSYWPTFKRMGIRTDDGSHTYLGHELTTAGQYIVSLASNPNLIKNPSFESGLGSWNTKINTSFDAGTVTQDSIYHKDGIYSLVANVTKVNTSVSWYSFEEYQSGFPLLANTKYLVSFWAKGDGAHRLIARVRSSTKSNIYWDLAPRSAIVPTSLGNMYYYAFTPSISDMSGTIIFGFGGNKGKVWIDSVSITKM